MNTLLTMNHFKQVNSKQVCQNILLQQQQLEVEIDHKLVQYSQNKTLVARKGSLKTLGLSIVTHTKQTYLLHKIKYTDIHTYTLYL